MRGTDGILCVPNTAFIFTMTVRTAMENIGYLLKDGIMKEEDSVFKILRHSALVAHLLVLVLMIQQDHHQLGNLSTQYTLHLQAPNRYSLSIIRGRFYRFVLFTD